MLESVKKLHELIKEIQTKTGLTVGEISEKAGYGPNYISEQISKQSVSKKLFNKIQGVLDSEGNFIKDAGGMILENQIELLATNRVILSLFAEIQAPQLNRLPTELQSIYRRMVKDEAEQVRGELKRK